MTARLQLEHLTVVPLVVVPAEMQDAVDCRLGQIGRLLGADHNVTQLARAGHGPVLVDREREHVRGLVETAVFSVELSDPRLADELDGQVAALDPRGAKGRLRGGTELVTYVGEVESLRAQSRELFSRSYSP